MRPRSLAVSSVTWARYRSSNFYSGSSIVLVFLVHHCTGCCGQPEEHLLLVGTEGSDRTRSWGRGDGTEMPSVGPCQGRTGSWDWVSRVQALGRSSWQGCGCCCVCLPCGTRSCWGQGAAQPQPTNGKGRGVTAHLSYKRLNTQKYAVKHRRRLGFAKGPLLAV